MKYLFLLPNSLPANGPGVASSLRRHTSRQRPSSDIY